MSKLKLPTSDQLGMDIKKLLIKHNPKSFKEWKEIASKEFSRRLAWWLTNNKTYTTEAFKTIYQIIFYFGFINYQHEKDLIKYLLEIKKFKQAYITDSGLDRFYFIDILAEDENGKRFCYQVKNNKSNLTYKELDKINEFSRKYSFVAMLAYKKNKQWIIEKI